MRDIYSVLGLRFKVADAGSEQVVLSCVGLGYSNINKGVA